MPVIIVPPSEVSGVSLLTLRNRLADELGFWMATAVTAAASGDAARVVLSSELRDDEAGYDFLGRPWLYVRSGAQAGTQRRIVNQPDAGYQGPIGGLMLSRELDAALVGGDVIEITSPLPVKRHLAIKGLNEIVNEALARIKVPARLEFTGNATYSYDLEDYGFLSGDVVELLGISDTRGQISDAYPPMRSPYGYRIVQDGVNRTLITQALYSVADTFWVDVVVDADRLVYDGSTWYFVQAGGTPGLQGDDWQSAAPEAWVVAFGMVKALQQLEKMIRADRGLARQEKADALADLADRKLHWARVAADIKTHRFPKPFEPPSRAFVGGVSVHDAPTIRPWI